MKKCIEIHSRPTELRGKIQLSGCIDFRLQHNLGVGYCFACDMGGYMNKAMIRPPFGRYIPYAAQIINFRLLPLKTRLMSPWQKIKQHLQK